MKVLYILSIFTFLLNNLLKAQTDVIISEFMAVNNSILQDEDGDYSDWIEIHNMGTDSVNLAGWVLTDDISENSKWTFPSITIDTNEYIIVFASGKDRKVSKDSLHTNFKLSSNGEFLALIKPGGTQFTTVFLPNYPEQYPDASYGISNNGYINVWICLLFLIAG